MAKLTETQSKVMQVLHGQTHGYLITPHATAFLVEGLNPGVVEMTLLDLLVEKLAAHITTNAVEVHEKHVTREQLVVDEDGKPERRFGRRTGRVEEVLTGEREEIEVPLLDDDGKQVVIAQGWHITDEGRAALSGLSL